MTALGFLATVAAGCATAVPPPPQVASPHAPVVLGTAILAPDRVVPVVTEAVRLDPRSAVAIAAAATAGVPDQASAIRAAVIREVPASAAGVTAVTTMKRHEPAFTRVEIPRHEHVTMLVEYADRRSGNVQMSDEAPDVTAQGVSRFGLGLVRTLGNFGRNVRQFVDDLK